MFHEDPREWWRGERKLLNAFGLTQPNPAHKALAELQRCGLLMGVVTQNVDGLHQKAGVAATSVVELHGTVHRMECAGVPKGVMGSGAPVSDAEAFRQAMTGKLDDRCGWSCPMSLSRVDEAERGGRAPSCPQCGGYLKTATVLFGEQLKKAEQAEAKRMMLQCDGLLIVGTSLNVYPAASYPTMVRGAKPPDAQQLGQPPISGYGARATPAPVVELNAMHPTSPAMPDVMLTGRAGEWLPKLAKLLLQAKKADQKASDATPRLA